MAKFFNEESVYEENVKPKTSDDYVPNFVGADNVDTMVSGNFDTINENPMKMVEQTKENIDLTNDTFANNERDVLEEAEPVNDTFVQKEFSSFNDGSTQNGWNSNQATLEKTEMVLDESNDTYSKPVENYSEIPENREIGGSHDEYSSEEDDGSDEVVSEEEYYQEEPQYALTEQQFEEPQEEPIVEEVEIKNPVYDPSLDRNDKEVSGNPLACLLVLIETFLFPSSSVIKNSEKYNRGKRVIKVYVTIMIFLLIFSIAGHIVGGCYVNRFIERVGRYENVFDFSLISKLNYTNIVIEVLIESFGITLLFSIINYAMSFFSNKGVSFGRYLLIITLSFFPVLLFISAIFPILKSISFYITIVIFIILLLYSLLIYFLSIKNVMEFANENRLIRYVLINVTIIIGASALVLYLLYGEKISTFLKTFL